MTIDDLAQLGFLILYGIGCGLLGAAFQQRADEKRAQEKGRN